ncbi:MAG: TolC family protein, partial [Helicobacter sp.]|nr:TolC family protein [Helicobacter sp.]
FNPHTIPADVLLSRPDIQASIQSLYAQIYNKANAKASLFPILSFSASLNEILHSSTQNSGNIAWQVAASLTAPLLNRTQLTQNYLLQDALLKESYLTLQKNLNTAFSEIENAIFNTQNTQLQLENNLQRLQNAKKYYEFSNNRRIIGLIDDLEYLNNTTLLNNSQKSLNTSANAKLQALITLFKAFGGNLYLSKGMQ